QVALLDLDPGGRGPRRIVRVLRETVGELRVRGELEAGLGGATRGVRCDDGSCGDRDCRSQDGDQRTPRPDRSTGHQFSFRWLACPRPDARDAAPIPGRSPLFTNGGGPGMNRRGTASVARAMPAALPFTWRCP